MLSALISNPDSYVCVGVENIEKFESRFSAEVKILLDEFKDRFEIREVSFEFEPPHVVRFTSIPRFDTDYVYICDADIVIFRDILSQNLVQTSADRPIINNFLRPEGGKLSGLHFTSTRDIWSPDDVNQLLKEMDYKINSDEAFLYSLVMKSAPSFFDGEVLNVTHRPWPGFHMSIFSRFPFPNRYLPGFADDLEMLEMYRLWMQSDLVKRFFHVASQETKFLGAIGNLCIAASEVVKNGSIEHARIPLLSGVSKFTESQIIEKYLSNMSGIDRSDS